jgi:hypothetical protein
MRAGGRRAGGSSIGGDVLPGIGSFTGGGGGSGSGGDSRPGSGVGGSGGMSCRRIVFDCGPPTAAAV